MRTLSICAVVLLLTATGAFGSDIYFSAIVKEGDYMQTGPASLIPHGSTPFKFGSHAQETSTSPDSLVSGSVKSGSTVLGTFGPPDGNWSNEFASAGALDAAYPSGSYTLSVTGTHDGLHSSTLSIGMGSVTYPNAPLVSNYNALQAIDPTQSFTVNWDAMIGGTSLDNIMVQIRGGVDDNTVLWMTPWPGQAGYLDGTATGVTVPSGVLAAENEYRLEVNFLKTDSYDLASYPGVLMATVYGSDTGLEIQTTPEPATISLLALGALALIRRGKR